LSRLLAVFALILIAGVFIFFAEFDNLSAVKVSDFAPEWVMKKYSLGETIEILERPQFFPDLVSDAALAIGFSAFTAEEVPQEYRDLAAEQKALDEPVLEGTVEGELRTAQVIVKTDQHVEGDGLEAKLVTTNNVASIFTRGEPVPVVGKINVPNLAAPYFYSITVYCCNQDKPMLNKGHVSTDGQGNFLYTIYTTELGFPAGIYDVIVSTLSADLRKNIDYKWQFDLR